MVEGQSEPVARQQVKVPESGDVVPVTGLKYEPRTAGEKQLTLRVAKHEGELVLSNNEISTFVTVLEGGLSVVFIQGTNPTWDFKYLSRAIGTSPISASSPWSSAGWSRGTWASSTIPNSLLGGITSSSWATFPPIS